MVRGLKNKAVIIAEFDIMLVPDSIFPKTPAQLDPVVRCIG
jgi:hypothetical protein